MPTKYPMPIQEAVRDLLMDLVGRGVAVSKGEPPELEDDTVAVVADYVTDDDAVGVVCLVDLPLAAAVGGALTMVPAAVVNESVRKNRFEEEMLLENYGEVANIMTRLFNSADTPHLRWRSTYVLPTELPADVKALSEKPSARRCFDVTVEGYGDGKLVLMVG
ncbi:MAG: hypothetical protein M5U14_15910 [Acidimicrobiia bacterium]|nr:hypothetical protein [Acidimicrobiia bacterium]